MMMPSPYDIQYFVEVAQTLNLSRAAERLGIRQPSLTLALQRLENFVGAALFIRTKRGVHLTDEGRVFLAQAHELLSVWQNLKLKTLNQKEEIKGIFRLGCHVSVALYSLPFFMTEFLSEYKNIEFSLEHDLSRKIVEAVISMRLDMGIVVNPVRHPDLVIIKLCDDEVCFWSKDEMNKDLKSVLIADENLLQVQTMLRKVKSKSKKNQQYFRRHIKTTSLEVARELAASGGGVAILPTRVAQGSRLKKLQELPTFRDEICLVYRSDRRNSRTIQKLSGHLKRILSAR